MSKKRSKRNTKRSSLKRNSSQISRLKILVALIILLCGLSLLVKYYNNQKFKQLDYTKTDLKSYPPELKKKITYYPRKETLRVPILMYHYVEYVKDKGDTIRQSLNIIPPIFENQMLTLKNDGYTFMTESQLADVLDGKYNLPNKPILITFDDGYRDFYTDVFPIIKKHDVKTTAYIVPGVLGGKNFMDADMVAEISSSGLVEVGDHTLNHISLKNQNKEMVKKEIIEAKTMLEKEYGIKLKSFAYPYGAFDEQAVKIVKESGFSSAVSTVPGISINQIDRYFMPRIRPGARTGEGLLEFLKNYKDPLSPVSEPEL